MYGKQTPTYAHTHIDIGLSEFWCGFADLACNLHAMYAIDGLAAEVNTRDDFG